MKVVMHALIALSYQQTTPSRADNHIPHDKPHLTYGNHIRRSSRLQSQDIFHIPRVKWLPETLYAAIIQAAESKTYSKGKVAIRNLVCSFFNLVSINRCMRASMFRSSWFTCMHVHDTLCRCSLTPRINSYRASNFKTTCSIKFVCVLRQLCVSLSGKTLFAIFVFMTFVVILFFILTSAVSHFLNVPFHRSLS